MRVCFLKSHHQPWVGKLWFMSPGKALNMVLKLYKGTPSFKPQNINWELRERKWTHQKFAETRFKLLGILNRHEKIDDIIVSSKKRTGSYKIMLDMIDVDENISKDLLTLEQQRSDETLRPIDSDVTLCPFESKRPKPERDQHLNRVLESIMDDIKTLDLLGEDSFARDDSAVMPVEYEEEPETYYEADEFDTSVEYAIVEEEANGTLINGTEQEENLLESKERSY